MEKQIKITIFTPTYNRSVCLKKLYSSLLNQTNKEFEWLIVDDGSTDDTSFLIKSFIKQKPPFMIKYLKIEHGGKHRAINRGISIANGELFFIVDSDDYLTNKAIEKIIMINASINEIEIPKYAGICGPKHYFNHKLVGTTFSNKNYLDITMFERGENNVSGDKAEVFFTNILKKYPFPEFNNEFYIAESVVWHRIAHDGYKMRYFNDMIYCCNYRDDGLSKNIDSIRASSPLGESLRIRQLCSFKKLSIIERAREYAHFYSNQLAENKTIKFVSKCLSVNPFYLRFIIAYSIILNKIRQIH